MAKADIKALFGDDFSTDNIIYVAKNGDDSNLGTIVDPFLTINAANNYAIANRPSYPVRIVVSVAPGMYQERIEDAYYRVYIVAQYGINDPNEKASIIWNTGADEDHYVIATTGRLNLVGFNINTCTSTFSALDGMIGPLSDGAYQFCKFKWGHFVEQSTENTYTNFTYCAIDGNTFKLSGTTDKHHFIACRQCDMGHSPVQLTSSGSVDTRTIKFERCLIDTDLQIGGDWSVMLAGSEGFGSGKLTLDTNGYVDVYKTVITNPVHFKSDTLLAKRFVNNYFRDIDSATTDITADVPITIVEYSGNTQCQGLCSCFQIAGNQRSVGGFAVNKYKSLQEAIDSIPANETGIITLYEDETNLSPLTINTGSKITIKCSKKFNMAFTGNIVSLSTNQELSIHEVGLFSGDEMVINGDNAILSFEGCLTVEGRITTTSGVGSMVISYFSSLLGITGYPVITANNADTMYVIGYSRVKGATGQEAIVFNSDADNKLKVKFSTLFHGDGGNNQPITYTGVGKVDISMYNSAMNAAMDASKFHNIIGSPNNTISAEIDF